MKMNQSDFKALCDMLRTHCQNERVDLAYTREQYKVNGLSETRFLFDLLYAIPGVQRQAWFDRGVYQYLNDDHIETALRRAVALLSNEQATSQG